MWSIWDRATPINGFSADYFISRNKQLESEEVIFIQTVASGRVTRVEGKSILSHVYGIDYNLTNDEFIAEYERIIAAPPEEIPEEMPEEIPEEEEDDITTYAELAQVYREGVNSIE